MTDLKAPHEGESLYFGEDHTEAEPLLRRAAEIMLSLAGLLETAEPGR